MFSNLPYSLDTQLAVGIKRETASYYFVKCWKLLIWKDFGGKRKKKVWVKISTLKKVFVKSAVIYKNYKCNTIYLRAIFNLDFCFIEQLNFKITSSIRSYILSSILSRC